MCAVGLGLTLEMVSRGDHIVKPCARVLRQDGRTLAARRRRGRRVATVSGGGGESDTVGLECAPVSTACCCSPR